MQDVLVPAAVLLGADGVMTGRALVGPVSGLTVQGGTATVALGGWHRVVLHAVVNGAAGSVDVTLDGVAVPGLTLTGQDLGTAPIARLQLGESSTGRTYDAVLDDVAVSVHPLTAT